AGKFTLVSRVLDSRGLTVAAATIGAQLEPAKEATFTQQIALPDALLWSLEHPNLYRLATTVRVGQTAIDEDETTFGVRTTRFDPEHGFFLNGQHVDIHGVCNHQDFPGVGVAVPDNLWSWKIQKLKDMGANAWRCAHNPAAEAFYRAADSMGMLVMDENRHLGDTYRQKADETTPFDDLSDVKAMVLQHRNHPSIIMWSMSNEEGQQRTAYGARIFAAMKAA